MPFYLSFRYGLHCFLRMMQPASRHARWMIIHACPLKSVFVVSSSSSRKKGRQRFNVYFMFFSLYDSQISLVLSMSLVRNEWLIRSQRRMEMASDVRTLPTSPPDAFRRIARHARNQNGRRSPMNDDALSALPFNPLAPTHLHHPKTIFSLCISCDVFLMTKTSPLYLISRSLLFSFEISFSPLSIFSSLCFGVDRHRRVNGAYKFTDFSISFSLILTFSSLERVDS